MALFNYNRAMDQYKVSIIEKSARIATLAHNDQMRKDGNVPYIVHPFMVALKLQKYDFGEETIAAALCHDVLEDTDYPPDQLRTNIGEKAYKIVKTVSYNYSLEWHDRKMAYIESVRKGPIGAKAVCVADKIHNLESIFIAYEVQGPALWNKFNKGKEDKLWFEESVLKMLKVTWDHPLIKEYESLIKKEKSLK